MFFGDHLMFKTFSFKFMSSSISQLPWAKFFIFFSSYTTLCVLPLNDDLPPCLINYILVFELWFFCRMPHKMKPCSMFTGGKTRMVKASIFVSAEFQLHFCGASAHFSIL